MDGDPDRRAGPTRQQDDVFDDLRRLYDQYGAGEVPQHILDLATILESELERALALRREGEAASLADIRRRSRRNGTA